ncbi:MAG: serine/threonine-protein kinase [Gemmataceae bacterium]
MTEAKRDSMNCPNDDDISNLVKGRDASPSLADHVGNCPGCQERLESVATAGNNHLSKTIRGLYQSEPPNQSAFWPALRSAELQITREFSSKDTPVEADESIDLSFLRASPVPGRIGKLGEFEIIKAIGKGGMGVVLHAFDPNLQRDVAIKVLDPQLATNSVARQRFCREARSAAAVTHENIVTVHQVDEDSSSGLPFLVMQLVVGESLEKKLRRVNRLSVAEAVNLGVQASAGLAAAHAVGLIHRDIKPGNILIENETNRAKLTDFGLARATEDLKLTKTGMVAGTPLYMAPEQANGFEPDQRADLFSLGSVLYESLAGRPAFDANTPLAVLRRIADHSHEPLRKLNPDVPAWLDEVIEELLRKDPRRRIGTAREVVERLASHAECVIPPLVGVSGEKCDVVKAASVALKTSPPFRRVAATFLLGSFGLGVIAGGLGYHAFFRSPVVVAPAVPEGKEGKDATDPKNAGPQPLETFTAQLGAALTVAPSHDGSTLAVGYESGRVQLFDLATKKAKAIDAHKGPIWSIQFSKDDKTLITASDDNMVSLRNLTEQGKPRNLDHPNAVRAAVLHPSGKKLISGDRNGIIWIWDLEELNPTLQLEHDAAINALAVSPDGKTLASSGTDGKIKLWDPTSTSKTVINEMKDGHRGPIYGLAFNHDGTLLASAGWDGKAIIWNAGTSSAIKEIKVNESGITTVAFSPCCKYLATAGADGLIRIWDLDMENPTAPAKLLATFGKQKGTVHSVQFFTDGKRLVSGGRDGSSMIWDIAEICPHK